MTRVFHKNAWEIAITKANPNNRPGINQDASGDIAVIKVENMKSVESA